MGKKESPVCSAAVTGTTVGVPELDSGDGDDVFLCGGDVVFSILWGSEQYDEVLELDAASGRPLTRV
jgi:hypothetical protein